MKAFLYFLLKMIGIDMDVQARGYNTPSSYQTWHGSRKFHIQYWWTGI